MIKKVRRVVNTVLSPFGVEVRRLQKKISGGEGYPNYLKEAQKEGMDVNDWIEEKLGWPKALPVLTELVFPYLQDDYIVCELGIGTGRWSRYLAQKVNKGQLHLVDYSIWLVEFAKKYFYTTPNVFTYLNDGRSLPFAKTEWIDIIFSNGTFIYLELTFVYIYGLEFFRSLKSGGRVIFNFIDPSTAKGWHFLQADSNCWFTYHTSESINMVLENIGFIIEANVLSDQSVYVVARKPPAQRMEKK